MHTEWWNELEMSEDERALERRECTAPLNSGHSLNQDCGIISTT